MLETWRRGPTGQVLRFCKNKGRTVKLSHMGHLLMGNRRALLVEARISQANCQANLKSCAEMVKTLTGTHRVTMGTDRHFYAQGILRQYREANATLRAV